MKTSLIVYDWHLWGEKRTSKIKQSLRYRFLKIENWRILYNHILFGIINRLLYEWLGNVKIYSPIKIRFLSGDAFGKCDFYWGGGGGGIIIFSHALKV